MIKIYRAHLDLESSCSIIFYRADQSPFGLPHFNTYTKRIFGHSLKVKVLVVLYNAVQNNLLLSAMTRKHETCANYTMEAVDCFTNYQRINDHRLSKLIVQLGNCTRRNKKMYLMVFFECWITAHVY